MRRRTTTEFYGRLAAHYLKREVERLCSQTWTLDALDAKSAPRDFATRTRTPVPAPIVSGAYASRGATSAQSFSLNVHRSAASFGSSACFGAHCRPERA